MTDVFISYKRRIRPQVSELAEALQALGLEVWFDAAIEPGTTFSEEISREVRTAKCVLACFTNDVFPHGGDEGGWVVGEATIGRTRRVLIAVSLEPTDLDPPWNTVHVENLVDYHPTRSGDHAGWRKVLLAIGRLVGRPGLADLDEALRSKDSARLARWARTYPTDPIAQLVEAPQQFSSQELQKTHESDGRPAVEPASTSRHIHPLRWLSFGALAIATAVLAATVLSRPAWPTAMAKSQLVTDAVKRGQSIALGGPALELATQAAGRQAAAEAARRAAAAQSDIGM